MDSNMALVFIVFTVIMILVAGVAFASRVSEFDIGLTSSERTR